MHPIRLFILGLLITGTLVAAADRRRPPKEIKPKREPAWKEHVFSGDGCERGVYLITTESTLSVLFSEFLINMPMNQLQPDGLIARKTCNFAMKVDPPEGMYLSGFRQVYAGGMVKSKGAKARLTIQYRLGNGPQNKRVVWEKDDTINPESPDSVFNQVYDDVIPPNGRCRFRNEYVVRMELEAQRRDRKDYLLGGLDSVDMETFTSLSVIPVFKPCK